MIHGLLEVSCRLLENVVACPSPSGSCCGHHRSSLLLLYLFKETVGEPFYLLVTTLNQKINKGPVDVITCKALYTLNEDWLLWQVPEFNTVVSLPKALHPDSGQGEVGGSLKPN